MIWVVWAVIAAAVGAAVVGVTFWPEIAERLRQWLRRNNLTKSQLASAVLVLDRWATKVRRTLRVTTQARINHDISIEEIDINSIDDPELRALLERTGHAEVDVLGLLD